MPKHRLVTGTDVRIIPVLPPFSCFEFIEDNYGEFTSMRRLFSLARSHGFTTLTIETIPAKGIISEENGEIRTLFPEYSMKGLQRFGFWDTSFKHFEEIKKLQNTNLIGYTIIKLDSTGEEGLHWHVFESVLRKYEHEHNCVPNARNYKVHIAGKIFISKGVMYCQQNKLNKACAHVALRAILDGLPGVGVLSYGKINKLAGSPSSPGLGLGPQQIQNVLCGLDIPFRDIDYSKGEEGGKTNPMRTTHPYRKFVYTGVESGVGSLLGFRLAQPGVSKNNQDKHIIPFFGHTFNKDTWVPDAALNYFEIGSNLGYIPSDNWTSSFIGHDDNFGSDFCVPKLYIKPEHVDYVVELLKPGIKYSGVQAEAMSLIFLYSLSPKMVQSGNPWMQRLSWWADPDVKKVVLRAVSLNCDEYILHLALMKDWEGNKEDKLLIDVLKKLQETRLPSDLWMIEVSIPHLFPANERKLGEIILDASKLPADTKTAVDYNLFVMARLPGKYYFFKGIDHDTPEFLEAPSQINSHVPLIKQHSA